MQGINAGASGGVRGADHTETISERGEFGTASSNNASARAGLLRGNTVREVPVTQLVLETRRGVYPRIDFPAGFTVFREDSGAVRCVRTANPNVEVDVVPVPLSDGMPAGQRHQDHHHSAGHLHGTTTLQKLSALCKDPEKVNEGCSWWFAMPPLMLAAKEQNVPLVRSALASGAKIDTVFYGMNVLHHAVEKNNLEVLEELAQHPDFNSILNVRNSENMTPLLQAAVGSYWRMVDRLLDLGADIRLTDSNGCSVLIHVIDRTRTDHLFRQYPAYLAIKLVNMGCAVNPAAENAPSPLMAAVECGHGTLVRLMVAKGADINWREGKDTETVLFHSIKKGFLGIATLLTESGADPNIVSCDFFSSFSLAAAFGYRELLLDMMETGRVDMGKIWPDGQSHLYHLYYLLRHLAHRPVPGLHPLTCHEMSDLLRLFGIHADVADVLGH